jgi:hypothetical protein
MQNFVTCFTLSFKIAKLLGTFFCSFQIAKPFNMINDVFSFSKFWVIKLFLKMDVFIFDSKALISRMKFL